MSKMKKLIEAKEVEFIQACDKPKAKTNAPTPESVVVTVAYSRVDGTYGIAVKLPGDQPVPKVGKAIALRNMTTTNFTNPNAVDNSDLIFEFFKVKSGSKKSFTPDVRDRIRYIFGDNIVAMLQD